MLYLFDLSFPHRQASTRVLSYTRRLAFLGEFLSQTSIIVRCFWHKNCHITIVVLWSYKIAWRKLFCVKY
jgi:hypothetical protein